MNTLYFSNIYCVMKKHENSLSQNIINTCQLPKDVLEGAFIISMTGNREIIIENMKSVITFQSDTIILQCKKNRIQIMGNNLKIESYTNEEIKIIGLINEIKF